MPPLTYIYLILTLFFSGGMFFHFRRKGDTAALLAFLCTLMVCTGVFFLLIWIITRQM